MLAPAWPSSPTPSRASAASERHCTRRASTRTPPPRSGKPWPWTPRPSACVRPSRLRSEQLPRLRQPRRSPQRRRAALRQPPSSRPSPRRPPLRSRPLPRWHRVSLRCRRPSVSRPQATMPCGPASTPWRRSYTPRPSLPRAARRTTFCSRTALPRWPRWALATPSSARRATQCGARRYGPTLPRGTCAGRGRCWRWGGPRTGRPPPQTGCGWSPSTRR
mmetsp:Transcript_9417/g.36760  ORF Transcript_9417/g.36760 Transcript_9417/m.36760 type:complete len:219 (+) Transcript_9417:245-901(+)